MRPPVGSLSDAPSAAKSVGEYAVLEWLLDIAKVYKPLVEFIGVLATPVLGVMIAWIAHQQYRLYSELEDRNESAVVAWRKGWRRP